MKKIFLFTCMLTACLSISCSDKKAEEKSYNQGINIVPKPLVLTMNEGEFKVDKNTKLTYSSPELAIPADYLAKKLSVATGYNIKTKENEQAAKNTISLSLGKYEGINDEGYLFESTPGFVDIKANTPRGIFYGIQSLLQLLPAEIESSIPVKGIDWTIPCVSIRDEPRFKWRGMHLDICRHFFPAEFIKKQIDVLAMYKINTLHLHLTDDQGWRIEVKRYPELTETGGTRTEFDGTQYGGYLTQEDIKDIVNYAQERYITIVPEIEFPGHAMAALTAYPELGCTGGPYAVRTIWGIDDDVFCAGKDETFVFMENVLNEIIPLFPGEYIHIGGDECPKIRWNNCPYCKHRMQTEKLKNADELQSYFVHRIETVVNRHNKKMIGWDEILEGGLAPTATVMSWRGEEGGIAAANMGHDVVMSPSGWLYINYYQADPKIEPVTIGGYNTLEKIYNYEPVPAQLPAEKDKHILGAQCNVWAEYMYTPDLAEYQIYPRIIALAEVVWTEKVQKDYKNFEQRMFNQLVRLDGHNINYYIPQPQQPGGSCNTIAFIDSVTVTFETIQPSTMVYTLDRSEPAATSSVYEQPFNFTESRTIKIRTLLPSGKMSKTRTISVEKQDFAPATRLTEKTTAGLQGKYAEGRFSKVEDPGENIPWKDIHIKSLKDIPWTPGYGIIKEEIFFGTVLTGYINIPEDNVYFFSTDTDQFWLDEKLLISNEGETKRYSRNDKSIALSAGLHPIRIIYLSNIYGGWPSAWEGLSIHYKKSGEENFRPVDDNMLVTLAR